MGLDISESPGIWFHLRFWPELHSGTGVGAHLCVRYPPIWCPGRIRLTATHCLRYKWHPGVRYLLTFQSFCGANRNTVPSSCKAFTFVEVKKMSNSVAVLQYRYRCYKCCFIECFRWNSRGGW